MHFQYSCLQGKQWIDNVQLCLMNAVVSSSVFATPNVSSNACQTIETLAFDSLPDCYTQNGFCDVVLEKDNCSNFCGAFQMAEISDFVFSKYGRQSRKQVSME